MVKTVSLCKKKEKKRRTVDKHTHIYMRRPDEISLRSAFFISR